MLKYEWKKMFRLKNAAGIGLLTIVSVLMMTRNLGNETNFSVIGALDAFLYTNNAYNMLLLFIIMMISTPVFSMEESCDMSSLIAVSSKGKNRIPMVKMLLVLLITEIYVMIYALTNIIGYKNSFGGFGALMPGINEFADMCTANNPAIRSAQDILLILIVSFAFYANFVALFTMYLSLKHIRPIQIYIFMSIFYIVCLFLSERPKVGGFFGLLLTRPFSTEDAYIILCKIGSISLTLKSISFFVYLILIGLMMMKIRNAYQTK